MGCGAGTRLDGAVYGLLMPDKDIYGATIAKDARIPRWKRAE